MHHSGLCRPASGIHARSVWLCDGAVPQRADWVGAPVTQPFWQTARVQPLFPQRPQQRCLCRPALLGHQGWSRSELCVFELFFFVTLYFWSWDFLILLLSQPLFFLKLGTAWILIVCEWVCLWAKICLTLLHCLDSEECVCACVCAHLPDTDSTIFILVLCVCVCACVRACMHVSVCVCRCREPVPAAVREDQHEHGEEAAAVPHSADSGGLGGKWLQLHWN